MIILGDFGVIWDRKESEEEKYNLDILANRSYTTLFLMGITKTTIGWRLFLLRNGTAVWSMRSAPISCIIAFRGNDTKEKRHSHAAVPLLSLYLIRKERFCA